MFDFVRCAAVSAFTDAKAMKFVLQSMSRVQT